MQQETKKKENSQQPSQNNRLLWLYAGFAFQLIAALGLGVYAGIWLDRWLKVSFPLLVWVLPMVIIVGVIIKAIRETGKGNKK